MPFHPVRKLSHGLRLVGLLAASTAAFAQPASGSDYSGDGDTRADAIGAAIINAVSDKITLDSSARDRFHSLIKTRVAREAGIPLSRSGHFVAQSVAVDEIAGLVADWTVLASRPRSTGGWQAMVRVDVVEQSPSTSRDNRTASVFVLPFSYAVEDEAETGGVDALVAVAEQFRRLDELRGLLERRWNQGLVKARVLGVGVGADPRLRMAQGNPGNVPWAELAQAAAVEYFLLVDVTDFQLEFRPENLRRKEAAWWQSRLRANWRLVTARDRVVRNQGALDIDIDDPALFSATRATGPAESESSAASRILAVYASALASAVQGRIVPAELKSVSPDRLLLDPGANEFFGGERLVIADAGVVEKGSGLATWIPGNRVAVLDVVSVREDGQIEARLARGEPATLQPGAVARRIEDMPLSRGGP